MSLWNRLSPNLRRFNKRRLPTLLPCADREHEALEELYQDSDLSAAWRRSLLTFTASHLERHRLSRRERRDVKEALRADSGLALMILESIHKAAHVGAYEIRRRTSRSGDE